jgi:predicted dehydrogenase
MKVGIIGTGFMGVTHAAGWAQTPAQICGFCAETTAEAAPLAKQYHSKIYTSIDEMLPEVDVVDLCTPTFLHAEQVEKAARAGKDIICEKPLALDVQTAVEMLAVCQKMEFDCS